MAYLKVNPQKADLYLNQKLNNTLSQGSKGADLWSGEALAKSIGISYNTYKKLMSGEQVQEKSIRKFAIFVERTVNELTNVDANESSGKAIYVNSPDELRQGCINKVGNQAAR